MKTPIYFRDLNDDWKEDFKDRWIKTNKTQLLGAIELDTDVIIGYFVEDYEEKVEE